MGDLIDINKYIDPKVIKIDEEDIICVLAMMIKAEISFIPTGNEITPIRLEVIPYNDDEKQLFDEAMNSWDYLFCNYILTDAVTMVITFIDRLEELRCWDKHRVD